MHCCIMSEIVCVEGSFHTDHFKAEYLIETDNTNSSIQELLWLKYTRHSFVRGSAIDGNIEIHI